MAPGLLQRISDLRRSDDDLAADELREAATKHGCTSISQCKGREIVTVGGTITCVTIRPKGNVPTLVAELFDGSRKVVLVWLGQRRIRGIEPGVYLKATGRLAHPKGCPTIFNPAYELLPDGDAPRG